MCLDCDVSSRHEEETGVGGRGVWGVGVVSVCAGGGMCVCGCVCVCMYVCACVCQCVFRVRENLS